jgi:hypothetical protein
MIETWNEFHEGTDVAASMEYGRQYIELNRRHVDLFKAGIRPPRPRGPYSDFKSVRVTLGATNVAHGLFQFDQADGITQPAVVEDRECRAIVPTEHAGRYVYLRVDDSFKWADSMLVDLDVEYFDGASGSFRIEYDGSDPDAPFQGAYTATPQAITLSGTGEWKTARFRLRAARFLNSQNGGADLRIATGAHPFHLSSIVLSRLGLPAEAGAQSSGWQHTFDSALDLNWQLSAGDPPAFLAADGLLAIRTAIPSFNRELALTVAVDDSTEIEILARLRVMVAPAQGLLGGLTLSAGASPASGLDLQFLLGSNNVPRVAFSGPGLTEPPSATFAWQLNRWYWLRLRHQTNRVTRHPDLWARVWPADGETAEPTAWTLYWDYYPANESRRGRPGFVAGNVPGGAVECDFFLVKQPDLSVITVTLPGLKPPHPRLDARGFSSGAGFRLALFGGSELSWVIEASNDLRIWDDLASILSADDSIEWADHGSTSFARRFYRLRQEH